MPANEEVQERYREALAAFVEQVKQDSQILAAILYGSLSYDEVWELSDIDIFLVGRDEKQETQSYCLVENDVNIHATLYARGEFKRLIEGSLRSSFFHSVFTKSVLLFSRDETLRELYETTNRLGARDREIQLLRAATWTLPLLVKARKWLVVKHDVEYGFLWTLRTVEQLAMVEALWHGEITGREVIHQALRLNPALFRALYTDLIHGPKDEDAIREALDAIEGYLDEKRDELFGPLFQFLSEAGGVRTTTELNERFGTVAQTRDLSLACEWLAERGAIDKVSVPIRLTKKSRASVEEAAYYYDGGEMT